MKNALRIIVTVLAVMLCLIVAPGKTYASDIVASGTCGAEGDNLTWTLDSDGVLTISGEGAMADYTYNSHPWYSYKSTIKELVIGNSVTSIGDCAFYNCTGLTSITIPENITSIGYAAFENCIGLTEINYNARNVTSSNRSVFARSTGDGLSVVFGNAVEVIPDYLFENCIGLTCATIGENVTSISNNTFYNCTGLTSITIPQNVTSIGFAAFYNCTGLTSITIPENVTNIGNYVFENCTGLTEINYNARNVTSSNRSIFTGITGGGLSVVFGDTVEAIPDYLFENCIGLTSATIGENVTSIGYQAFYSCTGLTSITIPKNVTSLGDYAFADCTGLIEINYNARNITVSHSNAFYNAGTTENGITITIGNEVEIVHYSLLHNIKVKAYMVDSDNNSYKSINGLLYNNTGKQLVRCPIMYSGFLEPLSSVKIIASSAFEGCTGLTGVTIPENVSSIGNYAFSNCTGLTSITIPENVISLGDHTFYYCTGLTSATIGENVSRIGNFAFSNCTGLTSITIPESITDIGYYAFSNCTGLTSITIPENVTTIGSYAFADCTGLIEINYNARNVTSSDGSVFINAGTVGDEISVVFGKTVEAIPDYLFENCTGLTTATIGENVTYIGNYTFYNCTGLTSITIPENVTRLGDCAFYNCTGLTSITIPENITSIGHAVFADCTGLTEINYNARTTAYSNKIFNNAGATGDGVSVVFGDKVETIPDYLFYDLKHIKMVKFLGNKPSHGDYSFYNNTFTAFYPYGDSTWNVKPSLGYSNSITWIAYSLGEPVSAAVSQMPHITEYEKGSQLDITGLVLDVTFSDGCVESHDSSELDIVSYDFTTLGRSPVTVAYKGVNTTFYVNVVEYSETLIDSSEYPESPHNYLNNMDETYSFSYPGAIKIVFTFSSDTSVEDQADYLYVYDSNENLIATYTKKEAAGQTVTVYGDSFSIRLVSDDSYTDYGFSLDSIIVTTKIGTCENGHTWSEDISYTWSDDNSTVTAAHTCIYCGENETIEIAKTTSVTTATCTEAGDIIYTAEFKDPALETQTKTVHVDALGHSWSTPEYTWAEDYSTVTATRVCANDPSHVETETANAELHVMTDPTCTEIGGGYYYANFENPAFEYQSIDVDLPMVDHTPGEPVHEHETPATYTVEGGYDLVVYCTVCSTELSREHVTTGLLIDNPVISSLTNGDTNSGITVNWTTQTSYSKFRIQRKATGESKWTTITSAATGTNYVDKTAKTGGATYTYRIAGYTNGAWTDYSETVSLIRNPFTDVKTSASYFKALCWAYNNGIVAGTSTTKFSPNDNCTRGQFALMLWRMNGKPSTAGLENPFTDVKSSNGFYNGIVWCYNKGITAGTSATTFSPNNNITRWQMILMFWRMQNKPKSSLTTNPFTDVKETASYYKAALWAYENKITAVEKFMPNDLCTRWQLVLFLYRLNNLYHYI